MSKQTVIQETPKVNNHSIFTIRRKRRSAQHQHKKFYIVLTLLGALVAVTFCNAVNNHGKVSIQSTAIAGAALVGEVGKPEEKALQLPSHPVVASGDDNRNLVSSAATQNLSANSVQLRVLQAYDPQEPISLLTAGNYVILTKTGVTTTGQTSVTGDIGTSPIASTALTGFTLVVDSSNKFSTSIYVVGRIYAADYATPTPGILTVAIGDMQTAYDDAANRPNPDFLNLSGGNLVDDTLTPGLYRWASAVTIIDSITFNGNQTDIWILQITGNLNTATSANINVTGGAKHKNIFWQIAGEITLGTGSHIEGIFLGANAMTFQTGSSLLGSALMLKAVNLDTADIVKSKNSQEPSGNPSILPSLKPSINPILENDTIPSNRPSIMPSKKHSFLPSNEPSTEPSVIPSDAPSLLPSDGPSVMPSTEPSVLPSTEPSVLPSSDPSEEPSLLPSDDPSLLPSDDPSVMPSDDPSLMPSEKPSSNPSDDPSLLPSAEPSTLPSDVPSMLPSDEPSRLPSDVPSVLSSDDPSLVPSYEPSSLPSDDP
eukprot:scaffold1885_cov267-Chaetoceros_neogracile.AAC.1